MNKLKLLFFIVTIFSIGLNIFLMNNLNNYNKMRLSSDLDKEIIVDAQRRFATIQKLSTVQSMENRYVVVVNFPQKTCVALQLNKGMLGAEPVYCYNKADGRLVEQYTEEF